MRCRSSRTLSAEVRSSRDAYRMRYPHCQYTLAVGGRVHFPAHFGNWLELEHIWGRGRHGEHWSNYAMASPGAHLWKHGNLAVARVAIMAYKHQLAWATNDWRHFDLQALSAASGCNIRGWLECQIGRGILPEWCEELAKRLLKSI